MLIRIQIVPKIVGFFEMAGLVNLRFTIGITTAACQEHPPIMETNVIDQGELIVRYCLLKCPKEIIGGGHQQCTVLYRVLLITAQRGRFIFLRNTIKPFNERVDFRG